MSLDSNFLGLKLKVSSGCCSSDNLFQCFTILKLKIPLSLTLLCCYFLPIISCPFQHGYKEEIVPFSFVVTLLYLNTLVSPFKLLFSRLLIIFIAPIRTLSNSSTPFLKYSSPKWTWSPVEYSNFQCGEWWWCLLPEYSCHPSGTSNMFILGIHSSHSVI